MDMIAMDVHKRYSQVCIQTPTGQSLYEGRIPHQPGQIRSFLRRWTPGSPVAIETVGNWYWVADEIEAAGMEPRLVHAYKAKLMLGSVNKTDKLDARGLNRLQRIGVLPTVWIPPGSIRDMRGLLRTRMALSGKRTQLKNRVSAELDKYGFSFQWSEITDGFGVRGREILQELLSQLPPQTRYAVRESLKLIDVFSATLSRMEKRLNRYLRPTEMVQCLMSLPGVGLILASVLAVEIGQIERFPTALQYASYAGTTPTVHSSGGKTWDGRQRSDANHYLKWAYSEAANTVAANSRHWPDRHVVHLYHRLRETKGHGVAVGAVARHLAEASWWMVQKKQNYQDPSGCQEIPTKA